MAKAIIPSPIGPILIDDEGEQLRSLRILDNGMAVPPEHRPPARGSLAAAAQRQLDAYFEDGSREFDLPLAQPASARRAAIAAIPSGRTLSYGALARSAGSAPRAIGQACARNPFPVIIPCHRVVGNDRAIGHYSGGRGIVTKIWLLDHERRGGLL